MTLCLRLALLAALGASPAEAQTLSDRMRRADEADAALVAKVAARLRTTPERFAELARRQPHLRVVPEGEALFLCEIPVGAPHGPETPAESPILYPPGVAAAAVGGDNSRFIQPSQYNAALTFKLHSRPGAKRVIYLDFDGHTTPAGTAWGGRIVTPPYDIDGNTAAFSGAERGAIQAIWRQVAEDFAPFNVDVTTEEPGAGSLGYSGPGDSVWGMRVVIGGSSSDWYSGGAGGVAFVGSFQRANELPCFVFSKSLFGFNSVAYAVSHEVGHTFGLSHDGTTAGVEYYGGHGNWAPIMGAGYGATIVQWSRGDYLLANNTEDDLAVIAQDGALAPRDIALTRQTALPVRLGDIIGGTIQRDSDQAWYRLSMTDGPVDLLGSVAAFSPNLKLKLTLLDVDGATLAESVPNGMGARLQADVTSGIYYLVAEGVGDGDPTVTYDGYGSVGRFQVTGTWPDNLLPVASTAGSTPLAGKAPLAVAFRSDRSVDLDGTLVAWSWDFGDGSPVSTDPNPSHVYAADGSYTATLTVRDDRGGTAVTTTPVLVGPRVAVTRPLLIGSAAPQWVAVTRSSVQGRVTYRVLDTAGRPMPGVTLAVTLEGLERVTRTAVTDRMGYAVVSSETYPSSTRGQITFTVRSVALPGYAYLPALDRVGPSLLRR